MCQLYANREIVVESAVWYQSVFVSLCLYVCVSLCLSVSLYLCLSVSLSFCVSIVSALTMGAQLLVVLIDNRRISSNSIHELDEMSGRAPQTVIHIPFDMQQSRKFDVKKESLAPDFPRKKKRNTNKEKIKCSSMGNTTPWALAGKGWLNCVDFYLSGARAMSHICHVTQLNAWCHTYEWAMCHLCIDHVSHMTHHVTHKNESRQR